MRCRFCNIWRLSSECYMNEMTTGEGIALLRQVAGLGAGLLYLTGGEPLLRKDIGEILKHAKQMCMITIMGTNGFFLEDRVKEIKPYLDCLRVSLNSLKHNNGLYEHPFALDRVLVGIERAKEAGIRVIINTTVTSQTFNEMEDLAKFADHLNCEITLSPLTIISRGKGDELDLSRMLPDYKRYAAIVHKLKKKYSCIVNNDLYLDLVERGGVGRSNFKCKASHIVLSVNPQGDMLFPCDANPVTKINVKKAINLKRAWYSESANRVRREMKKYNFCKGCINRCYLLPSLFFSIKGMLNVFGNLIQKRGFFKLNR